MTTTTPTVDYRMQRVEHLAQSLIPEGLPAGVKLTLMGDRTRAVAASELAWSLAAGDASWDTTYPELAAEDDPQAAAVTLAALAADAEWTAFTTAIAAAARAVITPAVAA